ncbi:MAG TPA: toll/interleukin-1 receptor domain-containing protein, partial [Anaerolineales bacterium]|nr:toll/interleukin-1 receptor domain-containing protein [Anaerolineales bacterium]
MGKGSQRACHQPGGFRGCSDVASVYRRCFDNEATIGITVIGTSRQYRAFISYSHADERWAAWLQRSLEKYRVPRKLGHKYPDRRRLNPIFRDKEELASSADLGDSIRSALVNSNALVVVCSPTAAASRWVNEEIHCFRDLNPDGIILCCMVDGSTDPGSPDCAFPPALLSNMEGESLPEPLAADVRDQGDGKRGAFLKIAAGLLQVGIDDLRQRDQQRKLKILSGAALGAVLVAVTTAGLAIAAHLARQESDLRREQAENLIEFMLVELRDQLAPIGKLGILDSVGDQAMEYFAVLGDKGTPDEVLSRALALRQIGEVRFAEGRLEAALEAFRESMNIAAELYLANTGNNQYLFELGQSEFWVGYVAWERGDHSGASHFFEKYMQRTQTLL